MAANIMPSFIRTPLTPSIINEIGWLGPVPDTPQSFSTDINWEAAYRIWTCYGHRN
ncbi:hypothetical protein GF373_07605, partial [bacterium]|nr:hypothetical protein [bacterium]